MLVVLFVFITSCSGISDIHGHTAECAVTSKFAKIDFELFNSVMENVDSSVRKSGYLMFVQFGKWTWKSPPQLNVI